MSITESKMLIFFIWFLVLQVMTLSNGETLVMSGRSLKLVLESGTLEDAAPPTLANCVSVNISCNLVPMPSHGPVLDFLQNTVCNQNLDTFDLR